MARSPALPEDSLLLDIIQAQPPAPIRRGIGDSQLYRYGVGKWEPLGEDEAQDRMFAAFPDGFPSSKLKSVRYMLRSIEPTMPVVPAEETKYLVNTLSGVVDVTAHPRPDVRPHDPDYLFRYQIPHPYNPSASCPTIDAALEIMFPDPGMVDMIHEIFGYCLLPGFSLKKAILLYSREPHTGKSSLLNLLGHLIGHENEATVSLQDLDDHKFARASLQDKLINRSGDLGAYAPRTSSNFKSLVGGDPVLAEHKGQRQFSLINTAKLLFAGNSFAGTHEGGAAYSSRWLVVPFTVVHETNPDFLRAVTTQAELEGLLRHAISGAARLVANNGFTRPPAVELAERRLQIETDSVARYTEECLTVQDGATLDGNNTYLDYHRWARAGNLRPVGRPKFYDSVGDQAGVEVKIMRGRKRVIEGLRLSFPTNTPSSVVDGWKARREHGV